MCLIAQATRSIVELSVTDVEKRRQPAKHYVYVITVTWSDGDTCVIYRRYSRFFDFQVKLLDAFPKDAGKHNPTERIIPFLPGKIIFGRSHIKEVALKRLDLINEYCKQLVRLPPLISQCQHVCDFFTPTSADLLPSSDSKDSKTPSTAKSISEPIVMEQYLVIADYTKEGANEIDLIANEVIDVVEKNDTGWWFVSGTEGQGWIPSSYLELPNGELDDRAVARQSTSDHPYLATQAYTPQESDELSLEIGSVVDVMEKNLDGWWLVRCKGQAGRVPGTYLARTDTLRAKRLLEAAPRSTVDIIPNLASVSNLKIKTNSVVVDPPIGGGTGPPQPPRSVFPPATSSSQNPSLSSPTPARRYNRNAPPPLPAGTRPKISKLAQSGVVGRHGRHGEPLPEDSPLVNRKPPPPRRSTIKKMSSPRRVEPVEEPVYMTIAEFQNQAGDGISFKEGQKVEMLDKRDGGWWYVRIAGLDGWVPSTYIQKTQPKSSDKPPQKTQPKSSDKPPQKTQPKSSDKPPQHKLFATKDKQTGGHDPSGSGGQKGHMVTGARPLPQVPVGSNHEESTWSDDDWNSHDEDDAEYIDMDQAIYANEEKRDSAPPPLPAKGPIVFAEQRKKSPTRPKERLPVKSPRSPRPAVVPSKPSMAQSNPAVVPSKPSMAQTRPTLPAKNVKNQPTLFDQNKPKPPQKNKPTLLQENKPITSQQKPAAANNNNLLSELSSKFTGLSKASSPTTGASANVGNWPKLPTKGVDSRPLKTQGVGVKQQTNNPSTEQTTSAGSSNINVKSIKNMFEGR